MMQVDREEFSIEQMMGYLFEQNRIVEARGRRLTEILPAINSTRGLIAAFLALLELTRLKAIFLRQEKPLGEITARANPDYELSTIFQPCLRRSFISRRSPSASTRSEKRCRTSIARKSKQCIAALIEKYREPQHGIEIREVADGLRFSTKPEHHEVLKAFLQSQTPPTRLSLAALETLAVIAYKQPVTIPEIQEIRGVQASGVIKTLLDKKLVATGGRKEVLGRPILYKTTKEFLIHFGLKDLTELPSMEEFEELIKNQADSEKPPEIELPHGDVELAVQLSALCSMQERLQKILAHAGIASRRKAEEIMKRGRVTVNGKIVTELGTRADPAVDVIKVDGKRIRIDDRFVYVLLNKPKNVMSTSTDPEDRPTVMEYVAKVKERIYPVGRLDLRPKV